MFQNHIEWIAAHPFLAALAYLAIFCLIWSPFLIRAWRRWLGSEPEQSGITADIEMDYHNERFRSSDLARELMLDELELTPAMALPPKRVPMLSRFVSDDAHGREHDLAMVNQILGDQAVAGVDHGKQTDRPAPGENGYKRPNERIRVIVGPYIVVLDRLMPAHVSEERPNGSVWPLAEVPSEWEPVVVALAMEVLRLREGWRVSERDWQPR